MYDLHLSLSQQPLPPEPRTPSYEKTPTPLHHSTDSPVTSRRSPLVQQVSGPPPDRIPPPVPPHESGTFYLVLSVGRLCTRILSLLVGVFCNFPICPLYFVRGLSDDIFLIPWNFHNWHSKLVDLEMTLNVYELQLICPKFWISL